MIEEQLNNNKRIIKNTIFLYLRMLIMTCISFYTSRIVLHALGVVDFGLYNVVGGIVAMFSFMNGAMIVATQRFLNFSIGSKSSSNLGSIFCSSIFIHIVICILILILAETIGLYFFYNKLIIPEERLSAAMWVYQCSVLSCITMVLSAPYNAVIVAHEKMNAFAYISILEAILKLGAVLSLTCFFIDKLILYAILILLIQIIIRFIYQIYCYKHFEETKEKWKINKNMIKKIGSFATWNLLGNLALLCVTQGLNIVLNMFFGPAINAARAIAIQIQSSLNNFCINFQTAINPQITKNYASNNNKYTSFLVSCSSKFSFFVLYIFSLPLLIEINCILKFWLGEYPNYTPIFVRIILLISMVDAISNSLVQAINASGRIKQYQLLIGSLLLTVLPISYFVLKCGIMKPEIVFCIHLIINIIAFIIRIYYAHRQAGILLKQYLVNVILKIVIVASASCIIPIMIHFYIQNNLERLTLVSLVSFISIITFSFLLGLNSHEKLIVKEVIYNKIKKSHG